MLFHGERLACSPLDAGDVTGLFQLKAATPLAFSCCLRLSTSPSTQSSEICLVGGREKSAACPSNFTTSRFNIEEATTMHALESHARRCPIFSRD